MFSTHDKLFIFSKYILETGVKLCNFVQLQFLRPQLSNLSEQRQARQKQVELPHDDSLGSGFILNSDASGSFFNKIAFLKCNYLHTPSNAFDTYQYKLKKLILNYRLIFAEYCLLPETIMQPIAYRQGLNRHIIHSHNKKFAVIQAQANLQKRSTNEYS